MLIDDNFPEKLRQAQLKILRRQYRMLFDLDTLTHEEWLKKYPEMKTKRCPCCGQEV